MSSQPLLPGQINARGTVRRHWLPTLLIPALLVVGIIWVAVKGENRPKDDLRLAEYYLRSSPVIDGHLDVPQWLRERYRLNASAIDLNAPNWPFDLVNARKGHLGGFFWSIYTYCPADLKNDTEFVTPYYGVRDALEQLDVAKNLIALYPNDFAFCRTADDVMAAIGNGRIASLFGLEGAHSLESSLGALRIFHELGVRYMTLTQACNNAIADSSGISTLPNKVWGGLSPFGVEAIKEMNRLGIIVDLSHTRDEAALQALALTRAPVMMSHSDARALNDIPRNAADSVIDRIGEVGGVIMVNFYDTFLAPAGKQADVSTIADHIDYIGDRIGRQHVGIGSDFDGKESLPRGIEDVSSYPYIFAELLRRGWKQDELAGVAGANILRVLRGVEATAAKMKKEGQRPSYAIYEKRRDL